jgi:hypothetical protein
MTGTFSKIKRMLRLCPAVLLLLATLWTCSKAAYGDENLPLYGKSGVTPEAVRQGSLGSCYFHATIAALARSNPDTLRDAIHRNGDGSFTVHFFSGPDESVFPEDIEFGRAHRFDRSDGAWVLVLMRGYAQRTLRLSLVDAVKTSTYIPFFARPVALSLLDQSGPLLVAYDRAIRSVVNQEGGLDRSVLKLKLATQLSSLGLPSMQADMLVGFLDEKGFFEQLSKTVSENGEVFGAYKGLGEGGIPVHVLEAFLGSSQAGLITEQNEFHAQLRRLHAGSLALVIGTFAEPATKDFEETHKDWFVPGHCYTVMDYDETSQTVSLRNPWSSHPDPDGEFTLKLPVLAQGFEFFVSSHAGGR